MRNGYQPIESYGVIGNLQTVALVGIDGSIDFLCYPYLDSPTIFAGLLDIENGGRFTIAPVLQNSRPKQIYLSNSNILMTRFLSPDGVGELSDFMPISLESHTDSERHAHRLVRRAKCIRGEVTFHMICDPRFDYARGSHRINLISEREAVFVPDEITQQVRPLRLKTTQPLKIEKGGVVANFGLKAGESALFILEEESGQEAGLNLDQEAQAFKDTLNFWHSWIRRSTYRGRWREMVDRSALVLKLLTSQRYGSIAAAPTFGLPETIGGPRNWDYRFTWIRDASFTLYALSRLGFHDESKAFVAWLANRCRELPDGGALQLMYGLDGHHDLPEEILPNLAGYRRSSPVRIGNAAYTQLQLDIYGELLDSLYLYNKYGELISHELWTYLERLIDWVCANWDQSDEGIWEVRGGSHHFLYSRLMCWVAVDRGVRLAMKRSFPAPLERWSATRDAIYRQIFTEFWDQKRQVFVQTRGGKDLDASCLLMPLVKFIGPTDPLWLSTLRQIEQTLVDDSLVFRYRGEDGLTGIEGTFCMCSFWYVECVSRSGNVERARFLFEKMLGYANHLGLFAEELGPSGEHLGNYPQAFTHLALISAAFEINRQLDRKRG
jgi:GH15 family glucan-1,4-alpha-glucosidase